LFSLIFDGSNSRSCGLGTRLRRRSKRLTLWFANHDDNQQADRHRWTNQPEAPDLDLIRQEIDRIDEQMIELLCARFAASEQVRLAKAASPQSGIPYRPGREAIILRTLQAQAGDKLPAGIVERIWRTIISASTMMQADVRIVTPADVLNDTRYREAVELFAAMMPVEKMRSLKGCLEALAPVRTCAGRSCR
jgi:chorismate mutase